MSQPDMPIATLEAIPGREVVAALGLARGSVMRARHIGADVTAAFRNLIGGELPEYSRMMAAARDEALRRMVEDARAMGADAVVGMRFTTSAVLDRAAEVLAYGTAVKLKPTGAAR